MGKEINHSDHDQALTTLLETARKCNICLHHDNLQYKMHEVDFLGETYTINGHKPAQTKVSAITEMPHQTVRNKFSHSLA